MKHKYSIFGKKSWKTISIIVTSVTAAFILGIQTAGDFRPVDSTQADGTVVTGDFNANGHLDVQDARIALEIASGYRTALPSELAVDTNRDYSITVEDVLWILEQLERAPSTPKVNL